MFSLAHAGFMAIGAYVTAILILPQAQKEMMYILEPMMWPFNVVHAPFFAAVVAGGVAAAFVGLLMAAPCLRLGGDYLGIATLGFGEIIRVIFTNITPVTNGALGLKGIPAYANLGWNYFWCIFTIYVIVKLLSSNFGNTLRAVRDDEVAAKAMGIDTFKAKTISFVVGAFFAGIGGSLTGRPHHDDRPEDVQLPAHVQYTDVRRSRRPRLDNGLASRRCGRHGAARVAALRRGHDTDRLVEIAGIPGMRMLIFSLLLLFIILYRREGIIGGCEFSWDGAARFLRRLRKGKGGAANG